MRFKSSFCRVTDFSLIDSFQFNELRDVFMARTHFTREGIKALCKNCPAIEVLDLGEVLSIDDEVVEIITKNLHRLQVLKLNGERLNRNLSHYLQKHFFPLRKPKHLGRVVRSHLQLLRRYQIYLSEKLRKRRPVAVEGSTLHDEVATQGLFGLTLREILLERRKLISWSISFQFLLFIQLFRVPLKVSDFVCMICGLF